VSHAAWNIFGGAGVYFYPTRGSGISLNVGKTLILTDHCRPILTDHITAHLYCDTLYKFMFCLGTSTNRNLCRSRFPEYNMSVVNIDLDSINTIQVMKHNDYWNRHSMHEIVLLGDKNDSLTLQEAAALYPSHLKCGMAPNLHSCNSSLPVWKLWNV